MDNFRRRNRYKKPRRVVDGILNAPVRTYNVRQPKGMEPARLENLRSTNSRRIDDFKRPEGWYVASSGMGSVSTTFDAGKQAVAAERDRSEKPEPSLLHMTLPAGSLKRDKGKEKSRSRQGRWRTFRKWVLRSALAAAVLVFIIGGFLLFKGILKLNQVFKGGGSAPALNSEVTPELLRGEGDGRVNILLMGKGGPGHAGADLTDTIIVASIDPVNKDAALVSIPRDLWVTVPGRGSSKINAVYANTKSRSLKETQDQEKAERAGVRALQDMIGQVLGIPIHYYGMIDFEGFKQAVDTVGGVDIDVPAELAVKEHLWDSTTGKPYYLNVPAGLQHFDSTKALYFARSRQTSLRGDFSRSERQRLFIQALAKKVLSAGTYANPIKVSQLMSAFGDHLSTDLTVKNALRLMEIANGMDMSKIASIGLADPPNNFVRTDTVGSQSVVRPTAGFGDYSEIQNYIRSILKDPYLAKEDARVAVLNGSSIAGLASQAAEQLKTYGYNVTVVGDAPTQDYAQTILIDMTDGKKPFTKNYLEKRLEVKATTKVPEGVQTQDVDFVIILGRNE
jgi:LCP family protein required for cell wall assembly